MFERSVVEYDGCYDLILSPRAPNEPTGSPGGPSSSTTRNAFKHSVVGVSRVDSESGEFDLFDPVFFPGPPRRPQGPLAFHLTPGRLVPLRCTELIMTMMMSVCVSQGFLRAALIRLEMQFRLVPFRLALTMNMATTASIA